MAAVLSCENVTRPCSPAITKNYGSAMMCYLSAFKGKAADLSGQDVLAATLLLRSYGTTSVGPALSTGEGLPRCGRSFPNRSDFASASLEWSVYRKATSFATPPAHLLLPSPPLDDGSKLMRNPPVDIPFEVHHLHSAALRDHPTCYMTDKMPCTLFNTDPPLFMA